MKTCDLEKSETPNENKDNKDKVSLDKDCELSVEYQIPDVTVSTLECTNLSDSVSKYQTPECSQPVMPEDYDDAVDVSSMLDNLTMRTDHIYPINVTNLQQMHSLKVEDDDVDTIGLECSDVSEDNSKLLNYDMLLNDVKISLGNTVQPSAPAAGNDIDIFSIVYNLIAVIACASFTLNLTSLQKHINFFYAKF